MATLITKENLLELLKSYDIDTTMCQYELFAESYERYSGGETYKLKFKCPGDYLAYLSMNIHAAPTVKNLNERYDGIEDFQREILDEIPSIEAMAMTASDSWYGDGDDYIIYLKNLTTNELLYGPMNMEELDDDNSWED